MNMFNEEDLTPEQLDEIAAFAAQLLEKAAEKLGAREAQA